jgi:hypothetical protein
MYFIGIQLLLLIGRCSTIKKLVSVKGVVLYIVLVVAY